ncbi:hypothetical protein PRUPE_3G165700 [Prunus persica]|uniref:Uncharacterized protein n=1 Tax=Prunus persica TaxID=3760 RepID=A0A251Q123_PRUPE|nr:hypothetical protein PRUPE_3G165700 [Prunus persica]
MIQWFMNHVITSNLPTYHTWMDHGQLVLGMHPTKHTKLKEERNRRERMRKEQRWKTKRKIMVNSKIQSTFNTKC